MKNLMVYINPSKRFGDEEKIAVKIQIDNSLDLGWKREDILLVTNFPYQYNGIKSIILNDDVYVDFDPTSTKTPAIENLFERELIDKNELYWVHDLDAYQMEIITESELDLGKADMGLTDRGQASEWNMGSIFFKNSSKDIFNWIKDIAYKYKLDDESALWILTGHDLFLYEAETKLVKGYTESDIPGIKNINKRVKKINISYNFRVWHIRSTYEIASKPIKVAHFHFSNDRLLDSAMYGKNSRNKPLMPERLIKIFHKHGVKGIPFKRMKNLMIYLNPEKKFLDKQSFSSSKPEDLVKRQIDNSLKLSWKKEDIVLLTNFPYEYQGIKAKVLDDSLFQGINDKANKSNVIFHLLTQEVIKEAEFWWFHDLDVFQLRKIKSPEIDLEDTTAGFMDDGSGKFDTGSFFFRKESNKIFEWIRNRARKFRGDESAALDSLVNENYRGFNSMYKKLVLLKIFKRVQ